MIRPGKAADAHKLALLMQEGYERSVYRDLGGIDLKEARALFVRCVQGMGRKAAGGTMLAVAETDDGEIEGFIAGQVAPVYHVGTKLAASEIYWYVSPRAPAAAGLALLDTFIGWAERNPDVVVIKCGATDVIADVVWKDVGKLYARRGLRLCGGIYERRIDR